MKGVVPCAATCTDTPPVTPTALLEMPQRENVETAKAINWLMTESIMTCYQPYMPCQHLVETAIHGDVEAHYIFNLSLTLSGAGKHSLNMGMFSSINQIIDSTQTSPGFTP